MKSLSVVICTTPGWRRPRSGFQGYLTVTGCLCPGKRFWLNYFISRCTGFHARRRGCFRPLCYYTAVNNAITAEWFVGKMYLDKPQDLWDKWDLLWRSSTTFRGNRTQARQREDDDVNQSTSSTTDHFSFYKRSCCRLMREGTSWRSWVSYTDDDRSKDLGSKHRPGDQYFILDHHTVFILFYKIR